MDLEWATFWLTVVGTGATLVALGVATYLGVHEIRSLRREQTTREIERQVEVQRLRRSQAECVSAVMSVSADPHTRLRSGVLEPSHHAYVTIVNSSALPIYDARPSVADASGTVMTTSSGNFVAGGSEGHVHVPTQASRTMDGAPVELHFRDASGIYWHRLLDGELHESSPSGECEPEIEQPGTAIPAE